MLARAFICCSLILWGSFAPALTYFKEGEVSLRGTFLRSDQHDYLIINPQTRSMFVLDLDLVGSGYSASNYPNGTYIEVCAQVEASRQTENTKAKVNQIRTLAPNEALIVYPTILITCQKQRGCKNYGKFLEAPMLGRMFSLSDLPQDYAQCLGN